MVKPQERLQLDYLPVRPVLRMVRRPRRAWRARSRYQVCLVLLAGVLLAAAGWVALQAAITTAGQQLVQARTELAGAVRTGEELRLELAVLRSVERVEAVATGQLGFLRPPAVRVVPAAGGTGVPVEAPLRTVTLPVGEGTGAVAHEQPSPYLGAWDQFLRWLAGRTAEAGSWN
ncbi:MAG: hypothetical protein RDU89_05995 [bacterium]|nr:hypothetical protein [bacterium]